MSRKLKVYGVNFDGKTRRIVAATSRAAAARLIGTTSSHIAQHGCETNNAVEVELAMRNPGKVWAIPYAKGGTWSLVENL